MELFLIYVITRLTELKSGLSLVTAIACILSVLAVIGLILCTVENIFSDVDESKPDSSMYLLRESIRRVSQRGLRLFLPVFLVSMAINAILPTTRDAVVITGGYGLVEAVKDERVQKVFSKSAQVASKWLDEQLNPPSKSTDSKPPSK